MLIAERLKQCDLTAIYVPEPEDEAVRDLSRARETAIAREMIAYIWAISREVVLTPIEPKKRLSRVPAK